MVPMFSIIEHIVGQ